MLRVTPKGGGADFLPYGCQLIEEDDIAAVTAVLRSLTLTTGPAVGQFEAALASATGASEAVVCANGTAALHLAGRALDIKPGATAIVPTLTFLATANAMRLCGAEVVFADVDPATGLMEATQFAEALARCPDQRADVVLPVHLNGQTGDLEAIARLAKRNGVKVIEDACHAIGAQAHGASVGANRHCDLTVFSFHPVKTIAMGEGGAITTNDPQIAARMRRDRSHGMTRDASAFANPDSFDASGAPNPWSYEMHEPGFNYRANDIQCALGLSQLKKLSRFVDIRRALVAEYDSLLGDISPHVRLLTRTRACSPAWHLYVVRIDFAAAGVARASLMRHLAAQGIGTQVHYYPVHRQPYYALRYGVTRLPGGDAYYEQALSLPLSARMDLDDVRRVVDALARALRG